jgi:hypothetical protein
MQKNLAIFKNNLQGGGNGSMASLTQAPSSFVLNDEMVDFDEKNEEDNSGLVNSSYDEGDEKRVSSSSRVNFSKLTKKEQISRFKNM